MNQLFIKLHNMLNLDLNQDLIHSTINQLQEYKMKDKEIKSLNSLKLRYAIKYNIIDMIDCIIENNILMKRDYWAIIMFYIDNIVMIDNIFNKYILPTIDTYDIDTILTTKSDKILFLLNSLDGLPIKTSFKSNITDDMIKELKMYPFDINEMIKVYSEKIDKNINLNKINSCDILIDGANISHIAKEFNYNNIIIIIKKIEEMKLKPLVILHQRHYKYIIQSLNKYIIKSFNKYIIYTPYTDYDDNYLLYGMFNYNKMVVSNDTFRDHLLNFDKVNQNIIRCYIDMMTVQYINNILVFPQYSKCIQVVGNNIYIPTENNGMYRI